MKHVVGSLFLAGLVIGLSSCASRDDSGYTYAPSYHSYSAQPGYTIAPPPVTGESAPSPWPRVLVNGSRTNLLYEPQIDSWDGRVLTGREVVALQTDERAEPVFGAVTIQAVTLVDKTARQVSLENITVLGGDFPSARGQADRYLVLLRHEFPKELTGLSLDALEASFIPPSEPATSSKPLNNSPPRLIFSSQPAILVLIDGPPVYRSVPRTELQRVLNSRVLLLKDRNGEIYLHLLDGYLKAASLQGPWVVASEPPNGAAEAERQALAGGTPPDLLDSEGDSSTNRAPSLGSIPAPVVYVSTTPAELILFDGPPDFVAIPGTHLLYVANTTGNVFKFLTDQRDYVLVSGRWFRGPSLEGPWHYVAADRLPHDFTEIPDNSPKENVKASVAGTPQATEALIANSIPESTKVPRTTAFLSPHIDGVPRLEPIAGTPLEYVINSGTPILKVDENSWYACQNGVWFSAASINGPWAVATYVPPVVYTIPPNSPLHYLTYVQVYAVTPQEIYESYTPGYLGTEVEDGVVVYGTGYCYPPWIGTVWYGWPYTWGFGWGPCWTPWDDWCFDFGFGWGCGFGRFGWWHCHPPQPWWGPSRDWAREGRRVAWRRGDTASTAGNVYGRVNSRITSRPVASDSEFGGYGRAYNSHTGILAAGQRASVHNVFANVEPHAPGQGSELNGSHAYGAWGGTRLAGGQLGSRAAFQGSRSGYWRSGGYSHGVGRGGGYSHGGWGGGGHGGSSGGHGGGGGGGGGHGGGGGGGGHGGGGGR